MYAFLCKGQMKTVFNIQKSIDKLLTQKCIYKKGNKLNVTGHWMSIKGHWIGYFIKFKTYKGVNTNLTDL